MPKISGNSLDKFNKSCSALHQESNKIEFAFFRFFLRFSKDFTRIGKSVLLLKVPFCSEVPRTFPTLIDMPLVHSWDSGKIWGLAIGSLAWGGGGSGRIPAKTAPLPAGEVVGLDHTLT
jgi:hypothetical protein